MWAFRLFHTREDLREEAERAAERDRSLLASLMLATHDPKQSSKILKETARKDDDALAADEAEEEARFDFEDPYWGLAAEEGIFEVPADVLGQMALDYARAGGQ